MVRCSKCSFKAAFMCPCLNINLCQSHAQQHSIDHVLAKENIQLALLDFSISLKEKNLLKSEIKYRISILENCKKQITEEVFKYLKDVNSFIKKQ